MKLVDFHLNYQYHQVLQFHFIKIMKNKQLFIKSKGYYNSGDRFGFKDKNGFYCVFSRVVPRLEQF